MGLQHGSRPRAARHHGTRIETARFSTGTEA